MSNKKLSDKRKSAPPFETAYLLKGYRELDQRESGHFVVSLVGIELEDGRKDAVVTVDSLELSESFELPIRPKDPNSLGHLALEAFRHALAELPYSSVESVQAAA